MSVPPVTIRLAGALDWFASRGLDRIECAVALASESAASFLERRYRRI